MRLFILLLVLLVAAVGIYAVINNTRVTIPNPDDNNVFCTLDAKICPDGSSVGRVGPNCEFAACPVSTSTTSTTPNFNVIETRINAGTAAQGLKVTPLELLEDSRCPINVVCIQAGTVRIRSQVATEPGGIGTTTTLTLNVPFPFSASQKVTLIEVQPQPIAGENRDLAAYRFIFRVERQ